VRSSRRRGNAGRDRASARARAPRRTRRRSPSTAWTPAPRGDDPRWLRHPHSRPAAFLDEAEARFVIDPLLHAWTMPGSGSDIELLPGRLLRLSRRCAGSWLGSARYGHGLGLPLSPPRRFRDPDLERLPQPRHQRWTTPRVANVNARTPSTRRPVCRASAAGRSRAGCCGVGHDGYSRARLPARQCAQDQAQPRAGGGWRPLHRSKPWLLLRSLEVGALGSADIRFRRVDSKGVPQGSQATLLSGRTAPTKQASPPRTMASSGRWPTER
jgi:hypothetical protein